MTSVRYKPNIMISVRYKPNRGTLCWSVERWRRYWASVRSAKATSLEILQVVVVVVLIVVVMEK